MYACLFDHIRQSKNRIQLIVPCKWAFRDAKAHYYKTNLEQCKNSKDSWRFINHLLNRKTTTTTINQITVNGQTITGNDNIANEFNNYFCEIGPKLAQTIPPSNVDPLQYITANSNKFTFRQISPVELCRILDGIKLGKAAGLDKITNKLLKTAGYTICETLLYIFNLILDVGILPDDLKQAKVTPIYKEGDKIIRPR